MNRDELAHLVRSASAIAGSNEMLIIGSQSVLGTFDERELPDRTTLSREADIAFWNDEDETMSDRVDGAIGELSDFDNTFGIYAQGVSLTTATLPLGWRDRLVRFENEGTRGAIAWCLEVHDLALSKLAAHRPKDYEFVNALLDERLIDINVLRSRVSDMPLPGVQIRILTNWIEGWHPPR